MKPDLNTVALSDHACAADRAIGRASLRRALVACTILAGSTGLSYGQATAQPAPAPAASPAPANPAVAALLDRANFWRKQAQLDQAIESLNRVLVVDPANIDALVMIGEIQAERGHRPEGEAALAKLRAVAPGDPRIAKIDLALKIGPIAPDVLADARKLAKAGHWAEALERYNRLLHGNPAPDSLAVEYALAQAGTDDAGWTQGRDSLARVVRAHPDDLAAQMAYAQVLTNRDASRLEGINRLIVLARSPQLADAANQAWRQALVQLPADKSAIAPLAAYLAQHPNDADISARLADAKTPKVDPNDPSGLKRDAGMEALNAGKLPEASSAFEAAIAINPRDARAVAGLASVRQRQHRLEDAQTLYNKAIALDPASRGKWAPALGSIEAAIIAARPNPALSLIAHGQWAQAEAELQRQIAHGASNPDIFGMLAEAQIRQSKIKDAEQTYRALLSRAPRDTQALLGLAGVLSQQGRHEEALGVLEQAGNVGGDANQIRQARAQELREQAATNSDPITQAGLYRSALAADPNNVAVRLDYAHALLRQGGLREARAVMAEGLSHNSSPEMLRAAITFASQTNDPEAAATLLARLPEGERTQDMRNLAVQIELQRQIGRVIDLPRMTARARLLALAAQPDPEGVRGAAIARAIFSIGDVSAARRAIIISRDSTPNQGSAARIAYAGALLDIGDIEAAQTMMAPMGYGGSLPPEQKPAFAALRENLAIRSADALTAQGKHAEAYDRLAPALASDPDNPDMNLALARVYEGAHKNREALEITEALLRRNPANADARREAVIAAVGMDQQDRAAALVKEGLEVSPDDPKAWMASAEYNKAIGNTDAAEQDLSRARALRLQQLGYSDNGDDDSTLSSVALAPGGRVVTGFNQSQVQYAPLGSKTGFRSALLLYPSADRGEDTPSDLVTPPGLQQAAPRVYTPVGQDLPSTRTPPPPTPPVSNGIMDQVANFFNGDGAQSQTAAPAPAPAPAAVPVAARPAALAPAAPAPAPGAVAPVAQAMPPVQAAPPPAAASGGSFMQRATAFFQPSPSPEPAAAPESAAPAHNSMSAPNAAPVSAAPLQAPASSAPTNLAAPQAAMQSAAPGAWVPAAYQPSNAAPTAQALPPVQTAPPPVAASGGSFMQRATAFFQPSPPPQPTMQAAEPSSWVPPTYQQPYAASSAQALPRISAGPYAAAPGTSPPSYPPVTTRPYGTGQYIPRQYAQPQYAQPSAPAPVVVPAYAQPHYVTSSTLPPGLAPAYAASNEAPPAQVAPEARYQPQVQEYLPQYRPAPPPVAAQREMQADARLLRADDFNKPYRPALPHITGDETVPFGVATTDASPANFYDNPFRRSPEQTLQAAKALPTGNGLSGPDPLVQQIDQSLVQLKGGS